MARVTYVAALIGDLEDFVGEVFKLTCTRENVPAAKFLIASEPAAYRGFGRHPRVRTDGPKAFNGSVKLSGMLKSICPIYSRNIPRQTNLSRNDGWKSYFFFVLGHRIDESYDRCPETGKLLDSIPGLPLAFFSVLAPGMHIKAHRGSYKGVVRCHLGLIVPEPRTDVRIRVGDKMIYWEEGKCVIFDDTHKHEVWNDTNGIRVVLLFDVFRPLPGWLTLVNKTLLNLAYYLPEVRRAVRSQREWEGDPRH